MGRRPWLRLHCVEAGAGPLVVLLHGFPEFWYAWRHQIPALADARYRVVAPDLRGYNTSDKPPRVGDYRPRVLVQEVAEAVAVQQHAEQELGVAGGVAVPVIAVGPVKRGEVELVDHVKDEPGQVASGGQSRRSGGSRRGWSRPPRRKS
jgi:alpha/beta hydrolase fold